MNDPPLNDTVRVRMQGIRCEIDQDLEDVSASVHNMVDWKHYVEAYPWLCVGAAAALGFLIVPKRSAATNAGAATPTEPASTSHPAASSPSAAGHGWVKTIVTAVVGIAVREAIAYFSANAGSSPGKTKDPGTNHHDSTCTP